RTPRGLPVARDRLERIARDVAGRRPAAALLSCAWGRHHVSRVHDTAPTWERRVARDGAPALLTRPEQLEPDTRTRQDLQPRQRRLIAPRRVQRAFLRNGERTQIGAH